MKLKSGSHIYQHKRLFWTTEAKKFSKLWLKMNSGKFNPCSYEKKHLFLNTIIRINPAFKIKTCSAPETELLSCEFSSQNLLF